MLRLRPLLVIASTVGVVASLAGVSACGSLSNNAFSPSGGSTDSGEEPDVIGSDAISFSDGPSGDGADAGVDTGPPPPPGVLLVHASPSLSDQVFCWSVGTSSTGPSMTALPYPNATPMPAANYPGVPVGGAVPLADASSMMGGALTVYALDAASVAAYEQGKDCIHTTLCSCSSVMSHLNTIGSQYTLPAIAPNPVVPGATVVLWLRGCAKNDSNASLQRCGADWSVGTGNLRVDAVSVPGALLPAPDAGVFTVQAAQLSPSLALLAGDGGAVVSFGAQGAADASVVATLTAPDQIQPAAPQQLATNIPLASFGQLGFAVDVAGDAGAHLWMPLSQSLDLVDPTQNPSQYFAQPTSYLVTVIGDPAGAPPGVTGDGGYDGKGLHLLVLPLP